MGVHFHFFEHFISFKSLLKLSSRDTPSTERWWIPWISLNRNAHLGISDLSEFIDNIYLIITRSQDSQLNYEMIQCPSCKAVGNRRTTCWWCSSTKESPCSPPEAGKFPLQQYCRCDDCCKTDTLEGQSHARWCCCCWGRCSGAVTASSCSWSSGSSCTAPSTCRHQLARSSCCRFPESVGSPSAEGGWWLSSCWSSSG